MKIETIIYITGQRELDEVNLMLKDGWATKDVKFVGGPHGYKNETHVGTKMFTVTLVILEKDK